MGKRTKEELSAAQVAARAGTAPREAEVLGRGAARMLKDGQVAGALETLAKAAGILWVREALIAFDLQGVDERGHLLAAGEVETRFHEPGQGREAVTWVAGEHLDDVLAHGAAAVTERARKALAGQRTVNEARAAEGLSPPAVARSFENAVTGTIHPHTIRGHKVLVYLDRNAPKGCAWVGTTLDGEHVVNESTPDAVRRWFEQNLPPQVPTETFTLDLPDGPWAILVHGGRLSQSSCDALVRADKAMRAGQGPVQVVLEAPEGGSIELKPLAAQGDEQRDGEGAGSLALEQLRSFAPCEAYAIDRAAKKRGIDPRSVTTAMIDEDGPLTDSERAWAKAGTGMSAAPTALDFRGASMGDTTPWHDDGSRPTE